MTKYENYKDSGIDWLGEIPEHWNKLRLKDFGTMQNGISKGKEYFGSGFPFLSYSNVYNDSVDIDSINTSARSNEEDQKLYSVLENDVFFTRTSETIDEIGIASTAIKSIPTATFSGFVIRFRPSKRILYKGYSKYLYRANIYRNYLCKEIALVTRASLNQNVLGCLTAISPPLSEQKVIAQYLDTKTQAIDKKISLLEKKIDYYSELRKSLINDVVTKGLDKNVKLKSTQINIDLPENWKIERLKDSFNIFTGNSISDKTKYKSSSDSIPYVSTKDIDLNTGGVNYKGGVHIPLTDTSFKRTDKNTTLICIEGANAGKKIGFVNCPVSFVNKLCAIKGKQYLTFDRYIYYYLNSLPFKVQFFALINGLIGGVSINKIKEFSVILPPKKEQEEIANFLDKKTEIIDAMVNNISCQINLLQELRNTLINDVVTGKIKVVE